MGREAAGPPTRLTTDRDKHAGAEAARHIQLDFAMKVVPRPQSTCASVALGSATHLRSSVRAPAALTETGLTEATESQRKALQKQGGVGQNSRTRG